MIKNYIKVAWRNFLKNKAFSLINVAGLAMGLTCFLLISLYVLDELSYDRFHAGADRIYRINSDIQFGGTELHLPTSSDMMGETLKKDYPEVENFVRIYNSSGPKLIKKDVEYIHENKVAHADSTFFSVFSFPAIEGNPNSALREPNSVVLTESAARRYFGSTDVVGKTIETNEKESTVYEITAVIEDMPGNSHFNFDFLFSMNTVEYGWGDYTSHNFHTYILLREGADYKTVEKKLVEYVINYVLPDAKQILNLASLTLDEFERNGNRIEYSLMPLTQIHLYSDRNIDFNHGGDIQYVYIFSAVAFFILLIACINFMNLTTARSAGRAQEVGVRKVLGTERKNLIFQFLTESTMTVFVALLIAVGLTVALLPLSNALTGKAIGASDLITPTLLPFFIALPVIVGLLAGSYPAFFLSSFQPVLVLKGVLGKNGSKSPLRSTLVVFQFTISVVLIVVTLMVYRQLEYIQTKNLGFNKEEVLIINGAYVLGNNKQAYKKEMLTLSGVKNATYSGYLPVSSSARSDQTYSNESVMNSENSFNVQNWRVDYDYIPTLGMKIKEGRNFSPDFGTDSMAVIANESAVKVMGVENPVGKKLYGFNAEEKVIAYTIIGVVENFHYESLKQTIAPVFLFLEESTYLLSLKVNTADIPFILKEAEKKWREMAPGKPFSYRFLDDSFNDMYQSEQRVGKIAITFSILAIFIVCLGLFGLTNFMAEQRTKEIGIRKVLGSSVSGIVAMFSADFLKLVFIALIVAVPVAWYFMDVWLQDFAYRTEIEWWVFALAGIISIAIAGMTVSFQAVKAAIANPAESLRSE